jgi:branched-chain amino acid transport system substrate-binding protein
LLRIGFRAASAAAVGLALLAAGCGSSGSSTTSTSSASASGAARSGSSCKGGKIKIGSVSSLTGPATFPDVSGAAKATFDQINARGGINGCKVDYVVEDDKGDPQTATQAARDLVQNQGVVALAGSGGLLDCEVNGQFYAQQKIGAVSGLGVDGACWSTPNISPVNVGPFTLTTAMLYYASEKLHVQKLCVVNYILAGTKKAYQNAVDQWTRLTGKKLTLFDQTLPPQGDYTPYVLKTKKAGCQVVLSNAVEPQALSWMKIVDQQKVTGIRWFFLAPGYSDAVAKALKTSTSEVYAGTEWEPYTDKTSAANNGWRATMEATGRPLTAFSQGGYESATVMADVLKTIKGPITRASVYSALVNMKPISTPLTGTPYVFGPGKTHASNTATKIMQLDHGAWKVSTPDWVVLPKS